MAVKKIFSEEISRTVNSNFFCHKWCFELVGWGGLVDQGRSFKNQSCNFIKSVHKSLAMLENMIIFFVIWLAKLLQALFIKLQLWFFKDRPLKLHADVAAAAAVAAARHWCGATGIKTGVPQKYFANVRAVDKMSMGRQFKAKCFKFVMNHL